MKNLRLRSAQFFMQPSADSLPTTTSRYDAYLYVFFPMTRTYASPAKTMQRSAMVTLWISDAALGSVPTLLMSYRYSHREQARVSLGKNLRLFGVSTISHVKRIRICKAKEERIGRKKKRRKNQNRASCCHQLIGSVFWSPCTGGENIINDLTPYFSSSSSFFYL